jgi:hypothetical protein
MRTGATQHEHSLLLNLQQLLQLQCHKQMFLASEVQTALQQLVLLVVQVVIPTTGHQEILLVMERLL